MAWPRSPLQIGDGEATVGRQRLPGQESALVASQEADDAGDVVDRAETTQRCPCDAKRIAFGVAVAHRALGRHSPGRHGVDADLARAEFGRRRARDAHDAGLYTAIDDAVARR